MMLAVNYELVGVMVRIKKLDIGSLFKKKKIKIKIKVILCYSEDCLNSVVGC